MFEANKQVILDLIEQVWRRGKIDDLPQFWASDCINYADPASDNRGLANLRRYHEDFVKWFRDFEEIQIDVQRQIAENDLVATHMLLQAVHRNKQRRISLASIRLDRIVNGKIAEHWSIADMAGLLAQLE